MNLLPIEKNTRVTAHRNVRAERALNALQRYKLDFLGESVEPIVDLLTDMLHLFGHGQFYKYMNKANSRFFHEE
jgi:hypothetical protein